MRFPFPEKLDGKVQLPQEADHAGSIFCTVFLASSSHRLFELDTSNQSSFCLRLKQLQLQGDTPRAVDSPP
jgi:hypothetical protein